MRHTVLAREVAGAVGWSGTMGSGGGGGGGGANRTHSGDLTGLDAREMSERAALCMMMWYRE